MLRIRLLSLAIIVVVLYGITRAQTPGPGNDPRNISPAVGTGGSPGGPTGLFTIYDSQTLHKGEFTFSVAYSKYDRDPGNADITEAPLSFQIGLSDHLELFFNTEAYRKIRPHNAQNLSSFYLPNSTALIGCIPAAIISVPTFVSGGGTILTTSGAPLARPTGPPCNPGGQPVVPFPFVGSVGPNFGVLGSNFAPPFVTHLGPVTGGGTGWRAPAGLFAGIGSP